MRLSAFRIALPLGLLLILLVGGWAPSAKAQADSGFEGLPVEITAGGSASFDFRYVPPVEGLFSTDLVVTIGGVDTGAGAAPAEILLGGVAPVTVTVISSAANLYEIRIDVPADTLTRITAAGLASDGDFVLAFFVATDTGVATFDFRTATDDPAQISLRAPVAMGAGDSGSGGGGTGGGGTDGGGGGGDTGTVGEAEMGLPSAGSGGLADQTVSGVVPLAGATLLVALVALAGTTLARGRFGR